MITKPQIDRLANFLYGRRGINDLSALSPEKFYIGLSNDEIGADGVIKGEVAGRNYTRVEVANDSNHFKPAENGVVYNSLSIVWPAAGEDWGTIRTVFISNSKDPYEDETALYVSNVEITVPNTATLYFNGGNISLSVSGDD